MKLIICFNRIRQKPIKIDALKAKLKFRKYVILQQAEEKQTFNITKKREDSSSRINLTVEELTVNLKKLVKQAIVMDQQSGCARNILVGKMSTSQIQNPL